MPVGGGSQFRSRNRAHSWSRSRSSSGNFSPIAEHPVVTVRQGPLCIGLTLLLLIPFIVTLTVSETVAAKKTKVRAGDTAWVPLLAATITENIIVAAVVVDLQGQWIVPLKKSGKLAILMEAVAEECPWQAASLMVHNRTGLMAADQRASLVAAPLQAALWMNGTVPSQVATDWTFLGRYRNSVVGSSDSVTLYAYLLRHAVPIDSHQDATPMDWTKLDRRSVSQRLMAGDFEDLESAAAVSLALLHTSNSNEKDKQ